MKVIGKKGLSPVVATVLVILITIVAAGLIAPFVTNFVKSNLDESGSCFDVLGSLEYANTEFNCVTDAAGNDRTGFSVSVNSEAITGFKISLLRAGSSDVYEIVNGTQLAEIRMLQSVFSGDLAFPEDGGVRTYVADKIYDQADLFPVVDGKTCESSDSIKFNNCTDSQAISLVGGV